MDAADEAIDTVAGGIVIGVVALIVSADSPGDNPTPQYYEDLKKVTPQPKNGAEAAIASGVYVAGLLAPAIARGLREAPFETPSELSLTGAGRGRSTASKASTAELQASGRRIEEPLTGIVRDKSTAGAGEPAMDPVPSTTKPQAEKGGSVEPYNRRKHYGSTPKKSDRTAISAKADEVADHDPSLVKRYYEGDPATGEKPGKDLTAAERRASANDRSRMKRQPKADSNKQGAEMQRYSKEQKKKLLEQEQQEQQQVQPAVQPTPPPPKQEPR